MRDEGVAPEQFWDASPQSVTRDILGRYRVPGRGFWVAVVITAILFLIGILGFIMRFQGGFQDRAAWGYYVATFAYLLTTTQAAPLIAVGLLLTKSHLRRIISMPSSLFAAAGLLIFLMFIPILWLIPPVQGRDSIWFQWPIGGAPWTWDILTLGFLVLCGLAFFWVMARPDLAAVQDLGGGRRRRLSGFLAAHWRGDQHQWQLLRKSMVVLAALYFVALVLTNTLLSLDAGMSLVPGWRSAIFPPYHVLTSLEGAVASTIVAMGILRWSGFRSYLLYDQFWGLGKLLLSFALLGIYFSWAEFITLWYGRQPEEQILLQLLMVGPYLPVFLAAFFLSFFMPFLTMIWNPIRQSILGPILVSMGVLVGLFLDRIRLYVPAYAAAQVSLQPIKEVPPVHLPDASDIMIMIGFPAGAILLYLLASRLVPAISVWQVKELITLRNTRQFIRRTVISIGKPE